MQKNKSRKRLIYLFMRLGLLPMILICCLAGMAVAESANAQGLLDKKVSLLAEQKEVRNILQQLSKQTDAKFIYSAQKIPAAKKVSLKATEERLGDVLQKLFDPLGIVYKISGNQILLVSGEQREVPINSSQENETAYRNKEVRGTITDSTGLPLQGVSISVRGNSGVGTSSDANGKYILDVPDNAVIVFTMVGYETVELAVSGRDVINVLMHISSLKTEEEVVVMGFNQKQKKIAQTASVATINSKELKQSPVANITNALAGRLPGLITMQRSGEPGFDNSDLLIRGRATFNSTAPLITVDGVQKDYSAINLLDVNEVENITILKDASATALYGVKGANGVIIVTTKRGKQGAPSINVSSQTAIQTPTRLPQILGSYDYAKLSNEAYKNDNPNGILTPYSEIALEAYRTGIDPLKYPDIDWMDAALKNSRLSQSNFNISGGSPKTRYFVNVGYTSQDGIYKSEPQEKYDPNISFKRYNFRSNIDIDFDKDFSMSLNLFGAIENGRYPRSSASELFGMLQKVTPNAFPIRYPTGFYAQTPALLNPFYWLNTQGYTQNFNSSLSGMLSATRKLDFIVEGLSIKGNYSFDGYFRNQFGRRKSERAAYYNGAGDYKDLANYTYTGEDLPLSAPSSSFNQNRDIWMDVSLNYAQTFGRHAVTGLLLANRTQKVIGGQIPYVSQGLVSRLTYSYNNRYFGEINAGYNGTDNFSKNNRYGFFPAVSAGWVVSEEGFLKNSNTISFLKFRGSYGLTGNDQLNGRRWLFISEFNDQSGYSLGDPLNWISGVGEGPMANPNVSWEIARKANVGVELKLWNGLLEANLDVFQENRNDILITRGSVPSTIGVPGGNLAPVNFGKTINKGYEVELTHRKRIGKLSYFVRANMSLARNKIIFMDEEPKPYAYLQLTGHSLGQYFGLRADGFFNSAEEIQKHVTQFGQLIPGDIRYVDLNGDQAIDANDAGPIGKTNMPERFYGINLGLNWKNFDFTCLFQGAAGSNVMLSDQAAYEFVEGRNVLRQHLGRWTPETAATATHPVLHYGFNNNNHRPSSFFLKDASYTRLKNAEIGYTVKNFKLAKNLRFNSLRVYANGMNLITWDKIGGSFDPETRSGSGNNYPQQKVYNFGMSVNF